MRETNTRDRGRVNVNFKLIPELWEDFQKACQVENLSAASVITWFMDEHVKEVRGRLEEEGRRLEDVEIRRRFGYNSKEYKEMKNEMEKPFNPDDDIARTVKIESGMSIESIATLLQKEGIIGNSASFVMLARRDAPEGRKIEAGEYEFCAALPPREILHRLLTGRKKL